MTLDKASAILNKDRKVKLTESEVKEALLLLNTYAQIIINHHLKQTNEKCNTICEGLYR